MLAVRWVTFAIIASRAGAPMRASIRTLALKALDGDHWEEPLLEIRGSSTG